MASALSFIGSFYLDLGEYQKALNYYNQALPITRSLGNKQQEAVNLNLIGRDKETQKTYLKSVEIHLPKIDKSAD